MKTVELPPALSVGADYGVTLIRSAPAAARQFVDFLVGAEGQAVLHRYGFR